MKHSINLSLAIIAAGFTIVSCNNATKDTTVSTTDTTNSTTMMADTSSKMTTTPSTTTVIVTPEQEFINYAVPGNVNEIDWLNAGVKYGSKDVKDHAGMMLKDHEALGKKVKAYLDAHTTLTAPSVDTTNAITINDKTGKDWDKSWADKMVDDHAGLLDKLKASSTTVKDKALLDIINPAIKTVQGHLDMAKTLQGKMK
jgi:putative membrane protein